MTRKGGEYIAENSGHPLYLSPEAQEYVRLRFNELAVCAGSYDMLVFLDRSARALYPGLRDVMRSNGTAMPLIRFLNYGTEKTWKVFWNSEKTMNNAVSNPLVLTDFLSVLPENSLEHLHKLLYLDEPIRRLIIDEMTISGATQYTLQALLNALSYEGKIDFTSFIKPDKNHLFIRYDKQPALFLTSSSMFGSNNSENPLQIKPPQEDYRRRREEIRQALHTLAIAKT